VRGSARRAGSGGSGSFRSRGCEMRQSRVWQEEEPVRKPRSVTTPNSIARNCQQPLTPRIVEEASSTVEPRARVHSTSRRTAPANSRTTSAKRSSSRPAWSWTERFCAFRKPFYRAVESMMPDRAAASIATRGSASYAVRAASRRSNAARDSAQRWIDQSAFWRSAHHEPIAPARKIISSAIRRTKSTSAATRSTSCAACRFCSFHSSTRSISRE
jgi:hypothetical protein